MRRIRIINKNGNVKYVSEKVAADTRQLEAYGYIVQNLDSNGERSEVIDTDLEGAKRRGRPKMEQK